MHPEKDESQKIRFINNFEKSRPNNALKKDKSANSIEKSRPQKNIEEKANPRIALKNADPEKA